MMWQQLVLDALMRIERHVENLNWRIERMSGNQATAAQALTDLQAQVAQQTTVEQSAMALIQTIPQLIQDAVSKVQSGVDPNAIETLVAQLKGSAGPLASAVTANTSAAPAA